MPAFAKVIRFLLTLMLVAGTSAGARCESCVSLDDPECAELNLYRLSAGQGVATGQSAVAPITSAYSKFAERSYQQTNEMFDLGLRALKWQLMASDVLMILVVVVTLSGVAMSAYQLWISGRIAMINATEKREQGADMGMAASQLEISPGKVSVQTAFVGIIVLVISAGLLLLFVREVYTIRPLNLPTTVGVTK